MSSNQDLQMSKQMIIHYRSELSKYKQMLAELDKQLEKEKVRNGYLQTKLKDLIENDLSEMHKEISKLHNKITFLEVELEEERKVYASPKEKTTPIASQTTFHVNGYFNYAIILPDKDETNLTVIGDLHITNTGSQDIENLLLCLKLSPPHTASLSGKIATSNILKQDLDNQAVDWIFATDDWKTKIKNDGEYWICSTKSPHLSAGQTLSFKGFELSIPSEAKGKLTLEAFIYGENLPNPFASKNKLSIHHP
ncbi:hypothetical protein FIU87_07205 [Bacillus sp. THAF10]|uniref:hypothetical protein n=1 Tax=Bacillus sp. THAF10 TaxID=2587848 RepID=UPI0012694257|nr:hypothetical protein [Bacillus sp. THAF10]QFT88426.1 hypothetical protein FIU87_07205 [Bacillus sp. THAF10]